MGKRDKIIRIYKKGIDKAHEFLATKFVIVYRNSNPTQCGSCTLDPINNESTDPDCEECLGVGYTNLYISKTVSGTVSRIGLTSKYDWQQLTAGKAEVGDMIVMCKKKAVLTDPSDDSSDTLFHKAERIVANGITYSVKGTPFHSGIAGDIYTIGCLYTMDDGA